MEVKHAFNGSHLPDGWRLARFDEILTRVDRKLIIDDSATYDCVGVRWYGLGAFVRERQLGMNIARKQQWIIHAGDVVYNKLFAWKGAFAIADEQVDGCIVSDKFPTYQVNISAVDPRFMSYYFRTTQPAQYAETMSKGAAAISKLTLNPPQFWDLAIPLPSLPEQRRIVARIEELAGKIEEARRLRRAAVEETLSIHGALVVQVLNHDYGRQPIHSIAEVRGGIQKGPSRQPGKNPVRYLTVAHVQRNRISTGDPRYFEVTPAELERWRLESGDVLVIEGNGSSTQIGRTALFRGEVSDCVHQNHVIRVRPDQRQIQPEFLNLYLNSPIGQDEVQARSRTTSGLRTLSVGRIKQIEVPIPSLVEQRRITNEFMETQARVEAINRLQAETEAELAALLPAVLDRAFRGEL